MHLKSEIIIVNTLICLTTAVCSFLKAAWCILDSCAISWSSVADSSAYPWASNFCEAATASRDRLLPSSVNMNIMYIRKILQEHSFSIWTILKEFIVKSKVNYDTWLHTQKSGITVTFESLWHFAYATNPTTSRCVENDLTSIKTWRTTEFGWLLLLHWYLCLESTYKLST